MRRAAAFSLAVSVVAQLSAQGVSAGSADSVGLATSGASTTRTIPATSPDGGIPFPDRLPTTLRLLPTTSLISPFNPLNVNYISGLDHMGSLDDIRKFDNIGGFDYPELHSPSSSTAPYQPRLLAPKIVPYRTMNEVNNGTSAPNELRERRPWDSGGDLALYTRDGYAISLSGHHSSYPSMGFSNTLTLGQTWAVTDGIILQGGVYTSDNLYHTARFKDFGMSGSLGVEVTDGVKLIGFGAHSVHNSTNGGAVPPRMYTGDHYGGGIRFRVKGKLGIEAGARRDYNAFTRQWETTPYVLPVLY